MLRAFGIIAFMAALALVMRRGYAKGKLVAKGGEVDRETQPINFKWTMRLYWAVLLFGGVMLCWVLAEELGLIPRTLEG